MTDSEILDEIISELAMARKKHPNWPTDPIHAAAIVAEESGELIRAALQWSYEGGAADAIGTEAIHTAATCVRLMAGR